MTKDYTNTREPGEFGDGVTVGLEPNAMTQQNQSPVETDEELIRDLEAFSSYSDDLYQRAADRIRALTQPSGKVSDEQVERACVAYREAYKDGGAIVGDIGMRAALEAAQLPARPVVKALEWTDSVVFGVRKWRGGGVFGEFAAFSGNLTDEQVSQFKKKYNADYERCILSALEGEGE